MRSFFMFDGSKIVADGNFENLLQNTRSFRDTGQILNNGISRRL